MKNTLSLLLLTVLLLFGRCTEEAVTSGEYGETGQGILVTAAMPSGEENTAPTRVALAQNGNDITLTWEEGDILYLCFVDGDDPSIKVNGVVTIQEITDHGKNSKFVIGIPDQITAGTFDLHGVYGSDGFSTTAGEEHMVMLPESAWSGKNLTEIREKDMVMLAFSQTGISKSSPTLSVNFQHVGSLFNIQLKNTGTASLDNITKAELFAETPIQAYQGETGAKYNLIERKFEGVSTSNTLPFEITTSGLAPNRIIDFWGWYSPQQEPGTNWPGLKLRVTAGGTDYETAVGKAPRTSPTEIGKVYYFFAEFDGSELAFSTPVTDIDGNFYRTVVIGENEWFAENLRTTRLNDGTPIPNVTDNTAWIAQTEPAYSWYNNNKTTYGIYGALYNWHAVNTGKLCPDGWHVSSDEEWQQLIFDAGGNNRSSMEKLKEAGPEHWNSPNDGTNEFGFTALPGGSRSSSNGGFAGDIGVWWTTLPKINDTNSAWYRDIYTIDPTTRDYFGRFGFGNEKLRGGSVRCVRDKAGTGVMLDKSLFTRWNPEELPYKGNSSYPIERLWDTNYYESSFYLANEGSYDPPGQFPLPFDFTFDLGQEKKLTHFMQWQRLLGDIQYGDQQVKKFKLYGSPTPDPGADLSDWVLLGSYEVEKPANASDYLKYAERGERFEIIADTPPVRYIRYHIEELFEHRNGVSIAEINFYSED